MNSLNIKDKIIHALKVARTKTIYMTHEQDLIDDALALLGDINLMVTGSDDYNEGFAHGHACAWEQAIMAKDVDPTTLRREIPFTPGILPYERETNAVSEGWNDCLDYITAQGWRVVK